MTVKTRQVVLDKFDRKTPDFLSEYTLLITDAVLTQHWHGFALSAQIQICYTEDAQKHIKLNLVASRRLYGRLLFASGKEKEEHL